MTTNLREQNEDLEREVRELKEQLAESNEVPDFDNPSAVVAWYGKQIIRLLALAKREKSLTRLRALSSAVDTWSKIYKLSAETSELQELREALEELRREVEAERRTGPRAVVK